jgi:hypothetical protein
MIRSTYTKNISSAVTIKMVMGILNLSLIFAQLLQSSPNFKHYGIRFAVYTLDFGRGIKLNVNNFNIFLNVHLSKLADNDRPKYESHLYLHCAFYRFINSRTIIVLNIKNFLLLIYVNILHLGSCCIFTKKELRQKVKSDEEVSIYYNNDTVDISIVFSIVRLTVFKQLVVIYCKQADVLTDPMMEWTQKGVW